jgi:trans-aconitate methyltransferase
MRALVGPTDAAAFDNPTRKPVYDWIERERYRRVLDFGCGGGRIARQLGQQDPTPERYVGLDLHRGMIECCRQNLAPRLEGFSFEHHDVFNVAFNPTATDRFR